MSEGERKLAAVYGGRPWLLQRETSGGRGWRERVENWAHYSEKERRKKE